MKQELDNKLITIILLEQSRKGTIKTYYNGNISNSHTECNPQISNRNITATTVLDRESLTFVLVITAVKSQ